MLFRSRLKDSGQGIAPARKVHQTNNGLQQTTDTVFIASAFETHGRTYQTYNPDENEGNSFQYMTFQGATIDDTNLKAAPGSSDINNSRRSRSSSYPGNSLANRGKLFCEVSYTSGTLGNNQPFAVRGCFPSFAL